MGKVFQLGDPLRSVTGMALHLGPWSDIFTQDSPYRGNVDLICSSPPYNIGSKAPRKDGYRSKGKFDPKSFGAIRGYEDNLPEEEYQQSQRDFLIACSLMIKDNGIIAYNHKNRHRNKELISPHRWFPHDVLTLQDEIVLDRKSSHNNEKSFMQPTTERLYIFKKPYKVPTYLNKTVTESFTSTKDIWPFPIIKDRSADRHCAPYDLKFAREVLFRYCPPGGLVCDPYSGSGTTMLACYIEGRRFIGSEKMEKWFDLSVSRYKCLSEGKSCQ
jgi:DNA modification methylase